MFLCCSPLGATEEIHPFHTNFRKHPVQRNKHFKINYFKNLLLFQTGLVMWEVYAFVVLQNNARRMRHVHTIMWFSRFGSASSKYNIHILVKCSFLKHMVNPVSKCLTGRPWLIQASLGRWHVKLGEKAFDFKPCLVLPLSVFHRNKRSHRLQRQCCKWCTIEKKRIHKSSQILSGLKICEMIAIQMRVIIYNILNVHCARQGFLKRQPAVLLTSYLGS